MVVASSVASPLCTWLVAACMTAPSEKGTFCKPSEFIKCPKKLSRSARRKSMVAQKSGSLVSSLYGCGINSLMSFCPFEPCEEYYNSQGLSPCFALFGENGFSLLFGSKTLPMNRKQRRLNQASNSGKTMVVGVQPEKQVSMKKKLVTKKRRVVVTGLGVVSPLGHDADVFYGNLLEGISGVSQIEAFDCTEFPTRIAGEIKNFSPDGWVSPKLSKRADKFMLYLLTAGKKALADGGITDDVMAELDKTRCGIIIGSALGGMKVFSDAIEALRISHKKMNPFCIPFATSNMGSAVLAIDLGWMGPNYSISAACATSNFCILDAANHIIRGETDMMLCGGSDAAIIPIGLGGFAACQALSQRNDEPTKASRPWDVHCDGFVMGEGAAVLLLEELEHAKRRGATIYAEFLGGSSTCDAYHTTEPHPDGRGIVLCIEKALAESGVAREDINYINAHATSTPLADLIECQAINHCFGQNTELRMNSTKSMIGHLLGAAGAVEAVATVKAIQTGWIHPNVNLERPDEGVDANILVGCKRERLDVKVALSNSLGFGGHNSSIVFAAYKDCKATA
ncbi:3-oxoacyl-[acyl-carrier-protein] synthase II, chloroplastic isoform X1 [Sesamum indicum]|uniref:3-oxoacyl-[acyl-carrier-protein] synthase I, chloroplastic n=1 Tax=Sesamum indicum TaxID=4182 RepID=A0A6I9STG0_SESIN|nr:3-oxoacyl-[acyl-carrier-protein] synthase II, chloroplastic isoform X1 [Sesamum indicum]XP_020548350.1 3-oxoacyl-[acyl-carrier-protein] synthase II, chloroplastic isoform X1 [Sesamum indicum]